jgi:hypothetical protein
MRIFRASARNEPSVSCVPDENLDYATESGRTDTRVPCSEKTERIEKGGSVGPIHGM